MTGHHIAQFNIARARAPMDDPLMAGFVSQLDAVNALADASPGFVWRLQDETGNATGLNPYDDPNMIVNMSVWENVDSLFEFVYRTAHVMVMRRRREWFEKPSGPFQALWWVPAGHRPDVLEGRGRLQHLIENGSTAHAFDFKNRFPAPGVEGAPEDMRPEPHCVGWS